LVGRLGSDALGAESGGGRLLASERKRFETVMVAKTFGGKAEVVCYADI
jgi:hypothetical protein